MKNGCWHQLLSCVTGCRVLQLVVCCVLCVAGCCVLQDVVCCVLQVVVCYSLLCVTACCVLSVAGCCVLQVAGLLQDVVCCVLQVVVCFGVVPVSPVKPRRRWVSVSVFPCWMSAVVPVRSPCPWECLYVIATALEWGLMKTNYFCCHWLCFLFRDVKDYKTVYFNHLSVNNWSIFDMLACSGQFVQRLCVRHLLSALRLVSDLTRDEDEETTHHAEWHHPPLMTSSLWHHCSQMCKHQ